MTRGFWHDPERYLETYWSRFPDVWVHGDWAAIDEDGLVVHPGPLRRHDQGRRQAARPGGGRIGPGCPPAVSEAAAIGVPDPVRGEAMVCFCVLKAEANGDEPTWPKSLRRK